MDPEDRTPSTLAPGAGRFRGPYADGPPPEALELNPMSLTAFGWAELQRMVVVLGAVLGMVARSLGRRVVRREGSWGLAASNGLIDAFIALGPTTTKAGQILASTGPVIPEALATASRRCLDAVPTFPTELVHQAIREDLGQPVEVLFRSFDEVALSAASIGQVHACVLADGRDAVIKVQRPGIRPKMGTDLRIAYQLARFFDWLPWLKGINAKGLVEDLHQTTFQELNPTHEAWQQDRFRSKIWAFGDNEGITAPEIYWDYCGPQLICMERVYGHPMDDYEWMEANGIDGQAILRQGAKVWAEATMIHGPFHGDMHAGNIWALEDGRGCYLDFGIMGELPDNWKALLKDLFYTSVFDLDFTRVARAYREVGIIPAEMGTDEELGQFLHDMFEPILRNGYGSLDIVTLVNQSLELVKQYQAIAPRELALVGKQLLYVDKYVRHLAPDYSLTGDPFLMKNIFPEAAAERAALMGLDLDDPHAMPTPEQSMKAMESLGLLEPADEAPADQRPAPAAKAEVTYPFLSDGWISAVRALRDKALAELGDDPTLAATPDVLVNLVVTDVPFEPGTIHAHGGSAKGSFEIDLGHQTEATLTVTADYATARKLVVDQDAQAGMMAFMSGAIQVEGDLTKALGPDANPLAMAQALGIGPKTEAADIDPRLGALADRIRALTE